ncbi:hypothetical protein [Hanstruepera marina]|uniref:hypothetical protein n=1 Tax=Hanstruepera marina TaxID=2873265 RepID=UPI001CA7784B|nr:hypothetical protein [Hanstruepera marina]
MRQTLIILYLLTFSLYGFSQISPKEYNILKQSIPEETSLLTTNSNVFLAGEYLYYKTILFNNKDAQFSNISKITYVELVGANNNRVFKHKLKVSNSFAFGDFFIPGSIRSGHYKLISYTLWSQNNLKDNYAEKDIFIINPFLSDNKNVDGVNNTQNITQINKTDSIIHLDEVAQNFASLKLNQSTFGSREKVSLQIALSANTTSINTLSVRKVDSIAIINPPIKNEIQYEPAKHYLPELRGEIISGYIESPNNEPVNDIAVSLSFSGKDAIYKNAVTNSKGVFHFIITGNYSNKPLAVQVQDSKRNEYSITLQDKTFNFYNQFGYSDLKLNSDLKTWIEQESVNHQIENAYFAVKADSIIPNTGNKDFYNSIETIFNLDDYTRFKTIRETFVEIVNTASLTKQDSIFVFNVPDLVNLDYNRDLNHIEPLILVDGILIQDNLDIVNYNNSHIESISTVTGQYVYGNSLYNGIISFKTYNGDFKIEQLPFSKLVEYSSLLPNKQYYQPNYDNNPALERIPDYRKQLLWVPNINSNENTTISFFTSDNKGLYQIVLECILPSGETQQVFKYFTVN